MFVISSRLSNGFKLNSLDSYGMTKMQFNLEYLSFKTCLITETKPIYYISSSNSHKFPAVKSISMEHRFSVRIYRNNNELSTYF